MELNDQELRTLLFLRKRGAQGALTGEIRGKEGIGGVSARISDLRLVHGFDIKSELEMVRAPKNRTGKAEVSRYTLKDTLNNRRKFKQLDQRAREAKTKQPRRQKLAA